MKLGFVMRPDDPQSSDDRRGRGRVGGDRLSPPGDEVAGLPYGAPSMGLRFGTMGG